MRLIVGLGNPDKEYDNTRHNTGFMALDKILEKYNITNSKSKFGGIYFESIINGEKIIFLKPQKHINLSGDVIKKYLDFFKIDKNNLLVIHDDMDISIGRFKLKERGSSAGHNGLKNIEQNLGNNEYKRIKIGISKNKNIDTKDYVLGHMSKEEKTSLNEVLELVPQICEDYLKLDLGNLMTKYNRKQ